MLIKYIIICSKLRLTSKKYYYYIKTLKMLCKSHDNLETL